jgi:hypothetical protein
MPPTNRMGSTLLIVAAINDFALIVVKCLVEVLTTHPQSGLYEPLATFDILHLQAVFP